MPKSKRSSTPNKRLRKKLLIGEAAVAVLGAMACLLAWLNGESVTAAVLAAGTATGALMNALATVATVFARHPSRDGRAEEARPSKQRARRATKKHLPSPPPDQDNG
jgi:hypothetical protein